MIYSFQGYIPVVHKSSFVHPLAAVTGNVIIGKNCYIGPGAAIRGDWGQIILEDGVNVQENCTVHMFPGKSVLFVADSLSVARKDAAACSTLIRVRLPTKISRSS